MIPAGLLWNQAEIGDDRRLHAVVASLVIIRPDASVTPIGTAFLVTAEDSQAIALTAAHCFEFTDRILNPNAHHHGSALPEFLPPPAATDLQHVKAVFEKDSIVHVCKVEVAYWDSHADLAFLRVSAPEAFPTLFSHFLKLTNEVRAVGDQVQMIGFGEMEVLSHNPELRSFSMQRRLVVRIGIVEEIHPEGRNMLRAHCIQTTIPIYSGMSGGLVAKYSGQGTQIVPFGLISYAPEPQPINDRSQSGHSIGVTIISEIDVLGENVQALKIPFTLAGRGRANS